MNNSTGLFGKFNGIGVYKTNLLTYVDNKLYNDDINMYLIDGDLIYRNQIIGRWDGSMVHEWDPHERTVFYRNTVKKNPEVKVSETKPTEVSVEPTKHQVVEVPAASAEDILAGVYEWQVG